MSFKSGFISIVGRPNAGKSTLINQLVKQKVAIISDKPQTTRDAIIAVRTTPNDQMIFIDTPGIHKPKHRLGDRMNQTSFSHFKGVDVIYYVMDGSEEIGKGDEFVIKRLESTKLPVFLIINKIDKMSQDELLLRIETLKDRGFKEIIPISASDHKNLDTLVDVTLQYLEEGPMYYPEDQVSAYPEQFIMAEIIREKVIRLTEEEIPHSVAVAIEKIVRKKNTTVVSAVIMVERPSQKGIIIGKQGQMIRKIGQYAREELETLLQMPIFLETHVKVEKDWRNKAKMLNQLGYIEPEDE
ncbi:GTPase Era [Erysipelothrix urinaevulpis]|uniref:GTPase Era n=1 Tax=Erysipelothrix urinaevulpis TaxID=2683717 RepID=UPI001356E8F3|nr:GTPase Era [Erysipelothrix urinaevulpis]